MRHGSNELRLYAFYAYRLHADHEHWFYPERHYLKDRILYIGLDVANVRLDEHRRRALDGTDKCVYLRKALLKYDYDLRGEVLETPKMTEAAAKAHEVKLIHQYQTLVADGCNWPGDVRLFRKTFFMGRPEHLRIWNAERKAIWDARRAEPKTDYELMRRAQGLARKHPQG